MTAARVARLDDALRYTRVGRAAREADVAAARLRVAFDLPEAGEQSDASDLAPPRRARGRSARGVDPGRDRPRPRPDVIEGACA